MKHRCEHEGCEDVAATDEGLCAYHDAELALIWNLETDLIRNDDRVARAAYERSDDAFDRGYLLSLNPRAAA